MLDSRESHFGLDSLFSTYILLYCMDVPYLMWALPTHFVKGISAKTM